MSRRRLLLLSLLLAGPALAQPAILVVGAGQETRLDAARLAALPAGEQGSCAGAVPADQPE